MFNDIYNSSLTIYILNIIFIFYFILFYFIFKAAIIANYFKIEYF